jgi:predicted PhzF superfamily epimerase YddE/YHI9
MAFKVHKKTRMLTRITLVMGYENTFFSRQRVYIRSVRRQSCRGPAFLVRQDGLYDLRWMTPMTEVDLCGHATLASAFVLFFERGVPDARVVFKTLSGPLSATRNNDILELDFPSRPAQSSGIPDQLVRGLGRCPIEVRKARDYLAAFQGAADVAALEPDLNLLCELDCLGVIAAAPGKGVDFVSRFFAPKVGVPEDPVTGSAHSSLIPYWSERFGQT